MISFSELTKQVHQINDLILSDMVYSDNDTDEETNFSRHLLATKYWFSRISWANKKRYLLALLEDVQSAWALSLLLKSMWNCRPKDSVLSVSEQKIWSSYDQVPMDHDRTATPLTVLAQVMKSDRLWFISQEPESQAMILSELLTISGGPVMWAILRRAQFIYERYRSLQLQNLLECVVVNDQTEKGQAQTQPATPKSAGHKETSNVRVGATAAIPDAAKMQEFGRAQHELEANLAAWNATIKSMKDSLKLEEIEMTFNDGTKRKIWKVNRPKPEAIETVDFLQLLPSAVGKRILSYLPRAQLGDYGRVNKYWAFLVDELRAELVARQKIDADYDKLRELMLRHDVSLDVVDQIDIPMAPPSSQVNMSTGVSMRVRPPPSIKASERSGGAYSLGHFLNEKLNSKPNFAAQTPLRNLADLTERLEVRGAADENLWKWCDNIQKRVIVTKKIEKESEGVLFPGNANFPCPLMTKTIEIPLKPPLYEDPAMTRPLKPRKNISSLMLMQAPIEYGTKRYSLWTRNFSSLYPVVKVPSYYQSPF